MPSRDFPFFTWRAAIDLLQGAHGLVASVCDRFYPYRPRLRDRRFWAIQALVVAIAATHTWLELMRSQGHTALIGSSPSVPFLSFIPVSLFIIPVVWAALGFGLPGALATAAWCTLLTVPNFFLHPGAERARELWQMGLVDVMAVFVGQRVDSEFAARSKAQEAARQLGASEARFRGLFESSPVPILVVSTQGTVADANPAAADLFGIPTRDIVGRPLSELAGGASIPSDDDPAPSATSTPLPVCIVRRAHGADRFVQPILTRSTAADGETYVQVLLWDMTEEQRRQTGLRAYAAHTLRAQEEERTRVAHELHDDFIQSLILLCRRLDQAEGETSQHAAVELRAARTMAEEIVSRLREFAGVLRPPTLDELGLVAAIRRLLAECGERASVRTRMNVSGQQRRMNPDAELGMFRIVQEALRNVERHAAAGSVVVEVTYGAGDLTVEIADDGQGFSPHVDSLDLARSGHLGILGMQERAELLGGTVELRSRPGAGTTVTVSMKLPGPGPQELDGAAARKL